ncbi:PucR family transcriptional regulator [Paraburkholderia fungorum]|uniref:PucR family transcriptional regulator n=1 Tax=Paraburkholderia fungorum TaxID=134537 RepID=UPI0020A81AF9|nr:helix-turn-helix domain-containing protein [Paraburkholderia fungorum]
MREKLKEIAENSETTIGRMYQALTRIEGYEHLTPAVKKDIMDSISLSERLWFDRITDGTAPSPSDLQAFQEFGRRRVHQGIALPSLLRAFRLGLREVWDVCAQTGNKYPELRDELLFVVSPDLMDYFDQMAQLISQSYLDEQYQQARWRQSLRYQLHEIIFNYSGGDEDFRTTAKALGLDPIASRIALAVELGKFDRNSTTAEGQLDRLVLSAARHLKMPHDHLVSLWHRDRLIIWAPCEHGEPMHLSDTRMAERVTAFAQSTTDIKAIGLGLAGTGAKGWSASAEEAIRALDFGSSGHSERRPVHQYSDIVIEESVRSTDGASRYLLSLMDHLSSEPDILLTLETFFANNQRRKVTAGALGIHPNTLDYRLERIENSLGAALEDVGWIAKLKVALTLHQHRS